MTKQSRDTGLSLLQQQPSREMLLAKMRGKLANTPSAAVVDKTRRRDARQRDTATWIMRIVMLAGFVAVNYLFIGHRELFTPAAKPGRVKSLAAPGEQYTADEKALYLTYALYDYPLFKQRFGLKGFLALNQADAGARLRALLPQVGPETLGIIANYVPMNLTAMEAGKPQ